jgi:hypothetical protein
MRKEKCLYIFCCAMVLVLAGCKKDPKPSDCGQECKPYPETNSVFGYQYAYDDAKIPSNATFNPNNPNEILYVEIANIHAQDLVVLNLVTKEKKVLHTGLFLNSRQWGQSGWILFNTHQDPAGGYTIYKIRPDGSQKEILVQSDAFYPVIHPEGNKFMYRQGSNTFVVKDFDGNTIKSCVLDIGSLYPTNWINDSIILFSRTNQVWSFNVNTCDYHVVVTSPFGEAFFWGAGFVPPDNVVWAHMDHGVFKTNLYTGETSVIKESCNGRVYMRMSYSPQIDRMMLYREDLTTPDSLVLHVKANLVTMKPDGSEEKVLDLGY